MEICYIEKNYIIEAILKIKEKYFNERFVKVSELNEVCSILQNKFNENNIIIVDNIDLLTYSIIDGVIFYQPKKDNALIDYTNVDILPNIVSSALKRESLILACLLKIKKDEYNNLFEYRATNKANKPPRSIVLDGGDGTGKSTQTKLLKEHLEKDGVELIQHHFPTYKTYQGVPVEHYLNGDYGKPGELSPYFVNSLYALDRVITWNTLLKPEYDKGKTILFDRYTTSSIIYQSALIDDVNAKKDFINYVIDYEYNKLGLLEPDLVIYLYLPFEVGKGLLMKRTSNDGVKHDIHEQDFDYLKKVTENALFVADYLGWEKIDCSNNNSVRTIQEIHDDVYRLIKK